MKTLEGLRDFELVRHLDCKHLIKLTWLEKVNLVLLKKERNLISIDNEVIFFYKIYIFHFFKRSDFYSE